MPIPPLPPPPLCSSNHVTGVVHIDRITDANIYWIQLTSRPQQPAAGTLRLITTNGHIDVAFEEPGPLEVRVPTGLLVLGAYATNINGTFCAAAHGASAQHFPGKPSDLPAAPAPLTVGPEIADDAPRCDHPFAAASVLDAAEPTYFPGPQMQGDVAVRVTIDSTGNVINAVISRSSNVALNGEALSAARRSTFRPQTELCTSVGGDYLFTVSFR